MHVEKFSTAVLYLFVSCCTFICVRASFVENSKFCIHTEPLLLIDTKDHINPQIDDPKCEIFVNALTIDEKAQLINTLCKAPTADYHFLKIRNGDLSNVRGSSQDICAEKRNPLLAWIPFSVVQKNFIHELNPNVKSNYLAKATKNLKEDKSNLCHFGQTHLAPGTTTETLDCWLLDGEDNSSFSLSDGIQVLIEILPIMYEIGNVTYQPWVNSTTTYKTRLGQTTLKNPRDETKQIYGSLNYGYVEKIKLNTKSVYGDKLEPLPLLFQHKGAVLELDNNGVGGVSVKDKAYFGRVMDPKSTVQVEVIGQWAEHQQQFNADVHEYFGYGIRRLGDSLQNGRVSFVLIESTEPVYDLLDETHRVKITLHTEKPLPEEVEPIVEEVEIIVTNTKPLIKKEKPQSRSEEAPRTGGHPYPGFLPWFIVACLIVGGALAIVLFSVLRSLSQGKKKHEYKLAA